MPEVDPWMSICVLKENGSYSLPDVPLSASPVELGVMATLLAILGDILGYILIHKDPAWTAQTDSKIQQERANQVVT